MRAVSKRRLARLLIGAGFTCVASAWGADQSVVPAVGSCDQPVYLTFDTGHMGVAPFIAEVLEREKIRATFFMANEPTRTGGMSLDDTWAPWWKKMAAQGHAFASHTFDHVYWLSDLPENQFKVRPSSGPDAGRVQAWSAQQYCDELARVDRRFEQMTGRQTLPLFRAPGGKTSPDLIQAGASCGYAHVGWSLAGFLGDELPSAKYPNAALLDRALKNIRPGDILMAHLGIWSRQDPWAPAVLEPLIVGLKQKGFCFATIDRHPDYQAWIKKYARSPLAEPLSDAAHNTMGDAQDDPDDSTDMMSVEVEKEAALEMDAQTPVQTETQTETQTEIEAEKSPEASVEPQPGITLLDITSEKYTQHE